MSENGKQPGWVLLFVHGFEWVALWCKEWPEKGDVVGTWPTLVGAFEDKNKPGELRTGTKPWAPLVFGWGEGADVVRIPRPSVSAILTPNKRVADLLTQTRAKILEAQKQSKIQIAGAPVLADIDRRSGPSGLVRP